MRPAGRRSPRAATTTTSARRSGSPAAATSSSRNAARSSSALTQGEQLLELVDRDHDPLTARKPPEHLHQDGSPCECALQLGAGMLARPQQQLVPFAAARQARLHSSAGSTPARSSEDLPIPEGPRIPTSVDSTSRASRSETSRSRPQKYSASARSKNASPLNGHTPSDLSANVKARPVRRRAPGSSARAPATAGWAQAQAPRATTRSSADRPHSASACRPRGRARASAARATAPAAGSRRSATRAPRSARHRFRAPDPPRSDPRAPPAAPPADDRSRSCAKGSYAKSASGSPRHSPNAEHSRSLARTDRPRQAPTPLSAEQLEPTDVDLLRLDREPIPRPLGHDHTGARAPCADERRTPARSWPRSPALARPTARRPSDRARPPLHGGAQAPPTARAAAPGRATNGSPSCDDLQRPKYPEFHDGLLAAPSPTVPPAARRPAQRCWPSSDTVGRLRYPGRDVYLLSLAYAFISTLL